jgi:ketosteroid isomerase-like protein
LEPWKGGRIPLKETETEIVLAANDAFDRAFNQKDAEAMNAIWSRRDDVTCVHPGWNLLAGRDDVVDSWMSILRNPDQARIVVGGAGVNFVGEVALVLCRELVGGMPLMATNIFVLEDGTWKLVHHHSGPVSMANG